MHSVAPVFIFVENHLSRGSWREEITCDRGEERAKGIQFCEHVFFIAFFDEEIYSYAAFIGLQSNNGVSVVVASDLDLPCEPESCHCHD